MSTALRFTLFSVAIFETRRCTKITTGGLILGWTAGWHMGDVVTKVMNPF